MKLRRYRHTNDAPCCLDSYNCANGSNCLNWLERSQASGEALGPSRYLRAASSPRLTSERLGRTSSAF